MKTTWVMLSFMITLFHTLLFEIPMTKRNNALDEEYVLSWNILFYKEQILFRHQDLLLLGTRRLTYNSRISLSEL